LKAANLLAKTHPEKPVKVVWSREELEPSSGFITPDAISSTNYFAAGFNASNSGEWRGIPNETGFFSSNRWTFDGVTDAPSDGELSLAFGPICPFKVENLKIVRKLNKALRNVRIGWLRFLFVIFQARVLPQGSFFVDELAMQLTFT